MSVVSDLLYFGPTLGPRRAVALTAAKVRKALRKRKTAAALRRGESDQALLHRLGLPEDRKLRRRVLAGRLAPLARLGLPLSPEPRDETVRRAERVRAGWQVLFGREIRVGWPPRWNWRWDGLPQQHDFVEDLRSSWEVQRLQGLLPLARAARLLPGEEGEPYAAAYAEALEEFHRRYPGPDGVSWASALEVGLRLVALAQGIPLVADREAFGSRDLVLLRMVDRHARWLAADLSLDKVVRGNHLLGELAGLVAAGALFPEARTAWWGDLDAQALLEEETLRQFHPDGVHGEQSLPYEKFILEFLLVAGEAAAVAGTPFRRETRRRLLAAAAHLEAVTAPDGTLPVVGDCDSGRGACWSETDPLRPAEVIHRARAVLEDGESATAPPRMRVFPQGGHVAAGNAHRDFVFLRGGPFGWGTPGPASHSHADLLCPVLYLEGRPVLVDPGVYGYRVPPPLRDLFRGWEAHNGVSLEPPPGPQPAGTFRWRKLNLAASVEAQAREDGFAVAGTVSWKRGSEVLQWHRSMSYNELERTWEIRDRLSPDRLGPVTWAFHFAPGVRVEPTGEPGGFRIIPPHGEPVEMGMDPPGTVVLETGPVALSYGAKEDAVVLRRRLETAGAESRVRVFSRPGGRDRQEAT